MKRISLISSLIILTSVGSSWSQSLQYAGSGLWTGVLGSKTWGNYIYCVLPNGLQVLDASGLDSVVCLSQVYLGGNGSGIAIDGEYIYLADNLRGLFIIDILDPANPIILSNLDTIRNAGRVYISDYFAYITTSEINRGGTLEIVDISDPHDPSPIGRFAMNGAVYNVVVQYGYAYVANGSQGLQIINISNQSNPVLAGNYVTDGEVIDVFVKDNYAYLADFTYGLIILDISDPAHPNVAGSYNTPGTAYAVNLSGNYAYIADDAGGLQVINVSDPYNPVPAGSVDIPYGARGLDIFENTAYVTGAELSIIDISNPSYPSLEGGYYHPAIIQGIYAQGDYAYVTSDDGTLRIVDISNLANTALAGIFYSSSSGPGVCKRGNYAYVANGINGLLVVDVSSPSDPILVGNCGYPASAWELCVSNGYAYMANQGSGLQIINISQPSNPAVVGEIGTPGSAYDVTVEGNYAYIADDTSGLLIVNISNPASPRIVSSVNTPGHATGVSVSGDYSYIADYAYGLQIINISNPVFPVLVANILAPRSHLFYRVSVLGNYAFVTDYQSALDVINISDPVNPVWADTIPIPNIPYDIFISGQYVYVTNGVSFLIFRYNSNNIEGNSNITDFSLSPAYPNPFNAQTNISYNLPEAGPVTLDIFDLLGRKITTLVNGHQSAGEHQIIWNASDATSGAYFYRLKAGDITKTEKCVLLK